GMFKVFKYINITVEDRDVLGSALQKSSDFLSVYPNPTNGDVNFKISLPSEKKATLKIFNLSGQKLITILDQEMIIGEQTFTKDFSSVKEGIYFVYLETDNQLIKVIPLIKK
ncbi:MAG: T9SS type A sorting domain-containing protein, partial [Mariniphaga sp.]